MRCRAEGLLQDGEVLLHDGEIGCAGPDVGGGDGLHGVEGQDRDGVST